MDEFSMVYYNNLLSLPCIFLLMYGFGELPTLTNQPALSEPPFLVVAAMGGLIGFAISFSSLWFLSQVRVCVCEERPALESFALEVLHPSVLLIWHAMHLCMHTHGNCREDLHPSFF
jgi:GDP-mannose transporter